MWVLATPACRPIAVHATPCTAPALITSASAAASHPLARDPCRPQPPLPPATRPAGLTLELHEPTVLRMQEHYTKRGLELNSARLRMATLPSPAEVLYTEGLWVPLVHLEGIYVLPGIPRLFQAMLTAHAVSWAGRPPPPPPPLPGPQPPLLLQQGGGAPTGPRLTPRGQWRV